MQILKSQYNNVVCHVGDAIETGIYDADPSRELYKITNGEEIMYSVTDGYILETVSDPLPEDYGERPYIYTKETGFYPDPNWVEPEPSNEEKLRADVDYIAAITGVEL